MRYFSLVRNVDVRGLKGPPSFIPVCSRTSNDWPIGEAYLSGINALGEPIWSLKIQGRWVGGRWLLRGDEFVAAR